MYKQVIPRLLDDFYWFIQEVSLCVYRMNKVFV